MVEIFGEPNGAPKPTKEIIKYRGYVAEEFIWVKVRASVIVLFAHEL